MKLNSRKIILISSSLGGGGTENVCVNIANNFAIMGWKVDLLVLNLKKQVFLDRLSKKVNLIILNKRHARYASIPLLKYIFKVKPKLVFVFNYELSVLLVILRILLRFQIKIISRNISILSIRINELKKENFWAKYVSIPMIKFFFEKVDYVINQCEDMKKDLVFYYPKLKEKSNVIFNPVDTKILEFANSNDLTKIERKNYLLCVGRLEGLKPIIM